MTTAKIAWLAGLLEGEGCFYFRVRKVKGIIKEYRFKKTALITVSSTDKDVIQNVSKMWNSSIYTRRNGVNKDYYTTVVNGKQAIGWMLTIYSYLGVRRRAKIREIVTRWK